MLIDIALIVIKYISPINISSFLLEKGISLDIKFSYNASRYKMDATMFSRIFNQFCNVTITGMMIIYDDN